MCDIDRRNACHRSFFQNRDILCLILSYFTNPHYFKVGRKDPNNRHLASAARVSKSFFYPAITFLWKRLHSVIPLLQLFPSCVLINNSYTIKGMISSQELQRVFQYSRHIRCISVVAAKSVQVHVIHHLLTHQDSLFPNLGLLAIIGSMWQGPGSQNTIDIAFLALSKSLTSISVTSVALAETDTIASILSVLLQKNVQLQEITLAGHLSDYLLTLLAYFPTLRNLDLSLYSSTLKSSTFISWASLPNLVKLNVTLDCKCNFDVQGDQGAAASFSALQSFEFGAPPQSTFDMLQCISESNSLTDVIIIYPDHAEMTHETPAGGWIFVAIMQQLVRISQSSLRNFSVCSELGYNVPDQCILTLSEFKALQTLELSDVVTVIHDETIRDFCTGGNWKNLRVLGLPLMDNYNKLPSISSLKIIAENCPSLQKLMICVNLQLLDEDALRKGRHGRRLQHPLKDLQLSITCTDDDSSPANAKTAIAVSRMIDHCFADLHDFYIHLIGYPGEEDIEWWPNIITQLLSEFKDIRMTEQEN